MRKKFCPKCGREAENLYDNLCKDCFLKNVKISEGLPGKFVIHHCKICGKFYVGNKNFESLESSVEEILKNIFDKNDVRSANYRIFRDKVFVNVESHFNDLTKNEEISVKLIVKNIICKYCSAKRSAYFKSIIQLRVPENLVDELLEQIKNEIDGLKKHDNFAFISNVESVKGGLDIYIGSKSALHRVVKLLKNKYRAETKSSFKLFGIKNGKKVYRETVMVSIK